MPSRSFFSVPDQSLNAALVKDAYGELPGEALRLISSNRAPLVNEGALAMLMGVSPEVIFSITLNKSKHYRRFEIAKANGKTRVIYAPRTYLKVVQWWILDNILSSFEFEKTVMGFVKGRGIVENANYHVGMKHIYNTDITDFFPSINESMVFLVFDHLGYSSDVALQLASICTLNGSLPQGAPTSPSIANIAARPLDQALSAFSAKWGLLYSRYADDLTFSSSRYIDKHIQDEIGEILKSNGFQENTAKRRFRGPGQRKSVTGLVVNDYVQLPRNWRKEFRAVLHNASKNPSVFSDLEDRICGGIGLLTAVYRTETHPLIVQAYKVLSDIRRLKPPKDTEFEIPF